MIRKATRSGGFTVVEMLIVCSLLGLVTTVVALLFNKGSLIYRHGEAHIEMQRSGRHLVSRLTPFMGSMFDRDDASKTPVLLPANAGSSSPELVFNTTEDWFAVGYPSPTTSAIEASSVSNLGKFTYRVRLINDATDSNNGNVVLERIDGDGSAGPPYNTTLPVIDNTRVLLRGKPGETIENFAFEWPNNLTDDLIRLTFTTRTHARGETSGKPMEINEDFRITFNLPKDI